MIRLLSICFVLLCGFACHVYSQVAPTPTSGDVLFLKDRVGVKTKFGVTGLDPGTAVRLVAENGNTFRVTYGGATFDVSKDKLSSDINEAKLAAQNYNATQQAGVQAFNAEVLQTQQEQKQTLEQQQRIQQEQKRALEGQQLATERQALLNAQRQQAADQKARNERATIPQKQRKKKHRSPEFDLRDWERQKEMSGGFAHWPR